MNAVLCSSSFDTLASVFWSSNSLSMEADSSGSSSTSTARRGTAPMVRLKSNGLADRGMDAPASTDTA